MRLLERSAVTRGALALLTLWVVGAPFAAGAWAEQKAEVPVNEFTLANGMKFLVVSRPAQATVMGGWVAHVGSACRWFPWSLP